VTVFSDTDFDGQVSDNPVVDSFFAYAPNFSGGVYVASTRIVGMGNNGNELITGQGAGGTSEVRVFSDGDSDGKVSDDPIFDSFQAYPGFGGGVRVAAGDTDNTASTDGIVGGFGEVITGAGPGGGPHITIRDDNGDGGILISDNAATDQFFAFDNSNTAGVFVAFGKVQTQTFANQFQSVVFDNSTTNSRIIVPAGAGIIRDLDVSIAISAAADDQLDITLTHVSTGTSVVLFTDVGGTHMGFIIRLNDAFASDIGSVSTTGTDPVGGGFTLEGAALLSAFNGEDASGEWRLSIVDDTASGTDDFLTNWSLHVTY